MIFGGVKEMAEIGTTEKSETDDVAKSPKKAGNTPSIKLFGEEKRRRDAEIVEFVRGFLQPGRERLEADQVHDVYQKAAARFGLAESGVMSKVPAELKPTREETLAYARTFRSGRAAAPEGTQVPGTNVPGLPIPEAEPAVDMSLAIPSPEEIETRRQRQARRRLPETAAPLVDQRGELEDYDEPKPAANGMTEEKRLDQSSLEFLQSYKVSQFEDLTKILRMLTSEIRGAGSTLHHLFDTAGMLQPEGLEAIKAAHEREITELREYVQLLEQENEKLRAKNEKLVGVFRAALMD